jgi:hypothetical protein
VETHFPPPSTFLEIVINSKEANLYYFDTETNQWTKNCINPSFPTSTTMLVELCHATQYAIFNLHLDSSLSSATDISIIVIIVIVLIVVIGSMGGALVYYRKKIKVTIVTRNFG